MAGFSSRGCYWVVLLGLLMMCFEVVKDLRCGQDDEGEEGGR